MSSPGTPPIVEKCCKNETLWSAEVNGHSDLIASVSPVSSTGESTSTAVLAQGDYGLQAPKYGTLIPNRIFVGGIAPQTTENDLAEAFGPFGNIRAVKIILDRAGVSKGYGFVTFETEEEAKRLYNRINNQEMDPIKVRDRKLNVAPAVKKQPITRPEVTFATHLEQPNVLPNIATFYFAQAQGATYFQQPMTLMASDQYYNPGGGTATVTQASLHPPPPQAQAAFAANPQQQSQSSATAISPRFPTSPTNASSTSSQSQQQQQQQAGQSNHPSTYVLLPQQHFQALPSQGWPQTGQNPTYQWRYPHQMQPATANLQIQAYPNMSLNMNMEPTSHFQGEPYYIVNPIIPPPY